MSELSYKELQEQGIFDVPYRAFEYMQSRQAKIDGLKKQLARLGYTDNGGELMKPPLGKNPDFGLVSMQRDKIDELQARIDGARSHVDHIYNVFGDDPDLAKLLDEMVEILKGK